MAYKNTIFFIVVIVLIITGGYFFMSQNKQNSSYTPTPTPTAAPAQSPSGITAGEKQKIDAWIEKNNFNPYGDPKDTAYTGGTPLFNESTGESIDRYEYITSRHPDRPWNK